MRLQTISILLLTLLGFALRLRYLTSTHPFFDEYTTVLAARQILRHGWPLLPSGLFYEHGLLATYLIAPFTALYINSPIAAWQPAHWGLMLSRWPSLLLGTATIPFIYIIGRQALPPISNNPLPFATYSSKQPQQRQTPIALLAAGLFALSPEGMVWGGRARMYALATLLLLLTVYWAYRGAVYPAPAKYRWWAMITLFATLLTQFGALMVVPPLVVAIVLVGWRSWPQKAQDSPPRAGGGLEGVEQPLSTTNRSGLADSSPLTPPAGGTLNQSHIWFLRRSTVFEAIALAIIIGLAILVKRLGRPVGTATLTDAGSGNILTELLNIITYQTAFHFTWLDTLAFLSRQFGVPHHLWLTIFILTGAVVGLIFWLKTTQLPITNYQLPAPRYFPLFLWLVFGLVILEMVTLLQPFRRNPRYIVMILPLFYLLAAAAIANFWTLLPRHDLLNKLGQNATVRTLTVLITLTLFVIIGLGDVRLALVTPEPAYEKAFAHIQAEWQPGDRLLTMNTPAAGLYLNQPHGFTVQDDVNHMADQFLLNKDTEPVDRWLGAPWLGQVTTFNLALNEGPRTWFVIDTIRQPVYFRGDWLAVVNHQMERVWAKDNAIVYRTRPDRTPLPTQPETLVNATLGGTIQLIGYAIQQDQPPPHLTLFWQALTVLPTDYTVFLHLRNGQGATVAQRDSMPVEGVYPTSRWQTGETIIDPITFPLPEGLPAGEYQFVVGLYQLDTLERLPVANDISGENAISLGAIILP